jgi:hypothetical protein
MGGGLMQLVAYGAQDIYLTGNPQITFFKVVYRRHTNFSMEAIEQTWNGTSDGADGRCTATISRNGDLVHRMYLELDSTTIARANIDNPSACLITSIELEIGGQKIDKHTGLWMELWAELTEPNPSGTTLVMNNGRTKGTLFQKMSLMGGTNGTATPDAASPSFIPLQFWFCRNPGLALPLIALQYHEVKVILQHKFATFFSQGKNKLFCDYIYLDTDERRRFAQVSHEYLIEQVQEGSLAGGTGELNFNHPVKELVWCAASKVAATAVASTLVPIGTSGTGTYKLKLNGHDRFAARDWRYFSRTQVWEHHSGAGGLDAASAGADSGRFDDSIGVYSFALKPEEHQPSGTCNFSRIDNARLEATTGAGVDIDKIFAVNYNVLRIMSGMGGLAYSN